MFDLDYLSELEQKATKAPWSSMPDVVEGQPNWIIGQEDDPNDGYYGTTDVLRIADDNLDGSYLSDDDAEFIAALRNAAPALFSEIRELRAMRENIRHILDSGYADVGAFQNDLRLALTEAQKQ